MTAVKTVMGENVRMYEDTDCFECAAWIAGDDGVLGLCNNQRADHFGHMISYRHPACNEMAVAKPGEKGGRDGR